MKGRQVGVLVATLCIADGAAADDWHPRVEAHASLWAGAIWGHGRYNNGSTYPENSALASLRFTLGVAAGPPDGINLRLGAAADLFQADNSGAAIGVELEADRPLTGRWRTGPRLSMSFGAGGEDQVASGNGQVLRAGMRLARPGMFVGVDGMFVRWRSQNGDSAAGNGVLLGAGVTGRSGIRAVKVAAITAGVVGILVVVALSQIAVH